MGSRLNITINKNGEFIGNCYWQSSGYYDEMCELMIKIITVLQFRDTVRDSKYRDGCGRQFDVKTVYEAFRSTGAGLMERFTDESEISEASRIIHSRYGWGIFEGDELYKNSQNSRFGTSENAKLLFTTNAVPTYGLGGMSFSYDIGGSFYIYIDIEKKTVDMREYGFSLVTEKGKKDHIEWIKECNAKHDDNYKYAEIDIKDVMTYREALSFFKKLYKGANGQNKRYLFRREDGKLYDHE